MLAAQNKLDLISKRPDGVFRLILVIEAGEWEHPDRVQLLQEKLEGYAAYALDGAMRRQYPEAKRVEIVVRAVEPPPLDVAEALAHLVAQLRRDIPVSVEPLYQAAA
jgi:hypothetical protein